MSKVVNKLQLKALAEENIYFAKRDRELIEALHKRKLAKRLQVEAKKGRQKARSLEQEYAAARAKEQRKPKRLGKLYRKLVRKALKLKAKYGR